MLLIEDNADARQMMRFLLEHAGHVVDEEVDGLRGIEAAVRGQSPTSRSWTSDCRGWTATPWPGRSASVWAATSGSSP